MARGMQLAWDPSTKRAKPVVLEEDVVQEIILRLGYAKIRVVRIKERIPRCGCSHYRGEHWYQRERCKKCPCKRFLASYSDAGIPDLAGWIPNTAQWTNNLTEPPLIAACSRPLFIEVKRPGGARRAAQEQFIAEALAGGCVAFFAESWLDVVRELFKVGVRLSA